MSAPRPEHAALPERIRVIALAIALDLLLGEPPAPIHPVVWIGKLITALERRAPQGSRLRQTAHGATLLALTLLAVGTASALIEAGLGWLPGPLRLVVRALLLKPSFAARELLAASERVRSALQAGDLPSARAALRSLVSRDTRALGPELLAAAAVESLAENAGDSIVAPLLGFAAAGLPGAYLYRASNTADAMIGYRGKYEYLGKAAARLDDLLNLVPARLTAASLVLGAALGRCDAAGAVRVARRDHARTESPNAGWPMSAMAGALGVQLEKVGHYRLGDSSRPIEPDDIRRAQKILAMGLAGALLLAAAARYLAGRATAR